MNQYKMLKYGNFLKKSNSGLINEQNSAYNKGEVLIFNTNRRDILKNYSGKRVKIVSINGDMSYIVSPLDEPSIQIYAFQDELSYDNDNKKETENKEIQKNNIEQVSDDVFSIGDRVMVDGKDGRMSYSKRKGTIKKSGNEVCLVELDDDDSRNFSKMLINISKSIISPLNEPKKHIYKSGDKVKCIDNSSIYFDKIGTVKTVWPDNDMSVFFGDEIKRTIVVFSPKQIELQEASENPTKTSSFITDDIKTSNPIKDDQQKTTNTTIDTTPPSSIEEEDDDNERDVTLNMSAPLKKSDLLEFSYKDFLLEDKMVARNEVMENKKKYKDLLKNEDAPEFKKIFYNRSLKTIDIIIQYYDFLINKIANDLPVYRTLEQIENKDLLSTKTKIKASESKEITNKYSFDQGIIAYWIFSDAVIFKTI